MNLDCSRSVARDSLTCTHDAGLRKQLPALKNAPPRYVMWGEGTTDEMCLGLLITTTGR